MKRRQDFLAAARGLVCARRTCVVQARTRPDAAPARTGFTVTKKLGNAVVRNRIRRRLKEAVRQAEGLDLRDGSDYVFIGRKATLCAPFDDVIEDARTAVARLNAGNTDHPRRSMRRGKT